VPLACAGVQKLGIVQILREKLCSWNLSLINLIVIRMRHFTTSVTVRMCFDGIDPTSTGE